ncbi:TRAP transporter substrate-binding protein [Bacillus taeanensis]|uniref:C4-dicarboxylate ABC transporter substrate-binding protein n=1 Tax=Bacillus taeanensis TaxID=273032 RepID=A0A366XVB5_9BACI|nr:TRAP transporter substrate-binding protein [Bacillus taeanensis]RBW70072.1 C4-dicarboxylate ABC transporter substrate-binding protein [Bacillus taeanensis]
MKKQLFFMLNILLAFTLLLSACSSSGANSESSGDSDTITFKATHVTQETHIWHKTAEKFGEELEALSGGKMKLEIYPAAQLGQEKDMVQQLETGSLDFGFLTNAYMSTRQESLNAWFMPFAFNNLAEAVEMKDSEPAKEMLAELESQGLVGLDYVFAGNRHVLMKENHVSSPEDLKGKKVRIIGSPAIQDFWAETGAGPTAMPLSEIYTSLQTGVIDGIDIDLDALVTEKYYENANKLTLTNHMTFPAVIVMSQQSYANLSEENQQIVKEALKKAVEWGNAEAIKREEENLQTLKDAGVEVQELSNPDSFDEIKAKVIDQYSQKSPAIQSFIDDAK